MRGRRILKIKHQDWRRKASLSDLSGLIAAANEMVASRHRNIFHLVRILAFVQILYVSSRRPAGYLVKKKLGKTYLGVSNKDKEELLEILSKKPHKQDKKPHRWDEKHTGHILSISFP